MKILPLSAAALLLLAGTAAMAQDDTRNSLEITSQNRWAQADLCVKQSADKYPNTNWTSLHNRDLFVDDCLEQHHLPKRAHLVSDTMPK